MVTYHVSLKINGITVASYSEHVCRGSTSYSDQIMSYTQVNCKSSLMALVSNSQRDIQTKLITVTPTC